MTTFHLQIATMDGNVFDGQVQSVACRTIHGDLAILARHMNYCTAIGMGTAHVVLEDGTERKAACIGGMLTMMNGECRLIPTTWEWSEDIDVARAEEAKKRAEDKPVSYTHLFEGQLSLYLLNFLKLLCESGMLREYRCLLYTSQPLA